MSSAMMRWSTGFVVASALVGVACSGTGTEATNPSPATDGGAASNRDGSASSSDGGTLTDAAATDGATDASTGPTLLAPVITMIMPMAGGLHVMWTNNQNDCDRIELERKSDSEAYKVAFTIPDGTVNNKHDGTTTAGTLYTYRVRCKKGENASAYSNEKSATP